MGLQRGKPSPAARATALHLDVGGRLFLRDNALAPVPQERFMSAPGEPLPTDHFVPSMLLMTPQQRDSVEAIEQFPISDEELSRRIELGACLGNGVFGTVYACTIAGHRPLAIKVPVNVHTREGRRRAAYELQHEFQNAERVLEPFATITASPSTPLARSDPSTYLRAIEQRCLHAAQRGYHFVHRPVHYLTAAVVPSLSPRPFPAILSERADGSVLQLIHAADEGLRLVDGGRMPRLWSVLAWQTLEGLGFIHATGLAHLDLKPANLLYCGDPRDPASMRCMIADFGTMLDADHEIEAVDGAYGSIFEEGTPLYLPTSAQTDRLPSIRAARLSDFQCLATLLHMLVFPDGNGGWWHLRAAVPEAPTILDAFQASSLSTYNNNFALLAACVHTLEAGRMQDWEELEHWMHHLVKGEIAEAVFRTFPRVIREEDRRVARMRLDAANTRLLLRDMLSTARPARD